MLHDLATYAPTVALTEARLGQDCGTWLNKHHRAVYGLFFHIPNGGLRTAREASALKSQHVKAGVSDYFLALPAGKYHGLWIELKTPTGRLTPEQLVWLEQMAALGYATALVRSQAEFEKTITDYLANAAR